MLEKNYYRRFAKIGPGGWKCPCCAPPPGKAKKAFMKKAKKKANGFFTKLIRQALRDRE